jgi:hypothetical protein
VEITHHCHLLHTIPFHFFSFHSRATRPPNASSSARRNVAAPPPPLPPPSRLDYSPEFIGKQWDVPSATSSPILPPSSRHVVLGRPPSATLGQGLASGGDGGQGAAHLLAVASQGAARCMLRPPRAWAGLARLPVLQRVPERLEPANAIFYLMVVH